MEYSDRYTHSNFFYSFSDTQQAFFTFNLTTEVDFKKDSFGISVCQQGDRLRNYKKTNNSEKFTPSEFNIILMSMEGTFIKARFGSGFTFTLDNNGLIL